jgi:pimeloyl-ACP methyl ester carboxylesterase
MSAPPILFIHGGGDEARAYDQKIAERLGKVLGRAVDIPLIAGLEALDWTATALELKTALDRLPPKAIVVAHSVGAAALVKLLADGLRPQLAHLFLLAPPYNGADGEWGDSDFTFPAAFAERLPRDLPITIYHSDDDDTIPVDNAHAYAEKLPRAKVVIVHGHDHQFTGKLDFLAKAIEAAGK